MSTSTAPTTGSQARRPMRADARRNYERLVEAGRTVFAERGADASMEEIAKQADVGVGTLYRHFPRRIDLVEAVYRGDVDTLVAEVDQLADTEPWAALELWLQAFIRYAQGKRVFLTELREAFDKHPELALESRTRIGEAAAAVLTRAQQAGKARADIDGSDLMHLIGGMCMAGNARLDQNERLLSLVLDGIKLQS